MYGMVLACVFVVIEMFLHNLKISVRDKRSLKKALLEEINFYLKFGENVKPVSETDDGGDGNGSTEEENDKDDEKKYSPPPLGFVLDRKPELIDSNTNGLPIGFIFDQKSDEDSGGSKSKSRKSNGRSNTRST